MRSGKSEKLNFNAKTNSDYNYSDTSEYFSLQENFIQFCIYPKQYEKNFYVSRQESKVVFCYPSIQDRDTEKFFRRETHMSG